MALIGRLFVILFGFGVACMAAATMVMCAFLTLDQTDFAGLAADPAAILVVIGLSSVTLSGYALLPSMLVVALAESFQLRAVLFYALAGGSLALVLTFGSDLGINVSTIFVRDREIMVAAGILAGLIYWTIAGRRAGAWRKVHSLPPLVHDEAGAARPAAGLSTKRDRSG
jgi:hypothetical protein